MFNLILVLSSLIVMVPANSNEVEKTDSINCPKPTLRARSIDQQPSDYWCVNEQLIVARFSADLEGPCSVEHVFWKVEGGSSSPTFVDGTTSVSRVPKFWVAGCQEITIRAYITFKNGSTKWISKTLPGAYCC